MKVGLDISQIAHSGGVSTYASNLASNLVQISDLEMRFFYSSLRKRYLGSLPNVRAFPIPPTLLEILFNRTRIVPIEKFIGKIDVFHSSDWTQPPTKAKKVTTYHDVIPLKYPRWSHPKIIQVHQKRLDIVKNEVDMVIAVSENTKQDLISVCGFSAKKIQVIYEGVEDFFKPQTEENVDQFKKRMNLPKDYILGIGGVGRRRNLDRIKEASNDYHLIITGVNFPWIGREEMPLLYSGASVLVYPSLYEGFGLPILEAMACGIPVITANVSSMPEVGGEAALYVDPINIQDIKRKLKSVMKDKDLRKIMSQKGLAQAKKFSWKKCAEETSEVYKKVIKI